MECVAIKVGEYRKVTRWNPEEISSVKAAYETIGLVAAMENIRKVKKVSIDESKLTFDQMKLMLLI